MGDSKQNSLEFLAYYYNQREKLKCRRNPFVWIKNLRKRRQLKKELKDFFFKPASPECDESPAPKEPEVNPERQQEEELSKDCPSRDGEAGTVA